MTFDRRVVNNYEGVSVYSHKVFSIFDSKAQAWLQPFFAVNAAVAVRMFERACNDENTDYFRFASDYSLFEVGEWSESRGELVSVEPKVALGVAVEFLKKKESLHAV